MACWAVNKMLYRTVSYLPSLSGRTANTGNLLLMQTMFRFAMSESDSCLL